MGILRKSIGGSDKFPPASIKRSAAKQPKPQMQRERPYLVRNPPPPLLIPRQKRAYRVIPNRTDHTREVVRSYDIQALQEEVAYLNRVVARACELACLKPALSLDLSQFIYSTSNTGSPLHLVPLHAVRKGVQLSADAALPVESAVSCPVLRK